MSWIGRDYSCENCNHEWSDLVRRTEQHEQECPNCGAMCSPGVSAPGLATYSMMDQTGRSACLKKRSAEHTKRMMKQQGKRRQ